MENVNVFTQPELTFKKFLMNRLLTKPFINSFKEDSIRDFSFKEDSLRDFSFKEDSIRDFSFKEDSIRDFYFKEYSRRDSFTQCLYHVKINITNYILSASTRFQAYFYLIYHDATPSGIHCEHSFYSFFYF